MSDKTTTTRPASITYTESQYADEVLRGLKTILSALHMAVSGVGMIASAWARKHALDKVTYKKESEK